MKAKNELESTVFAMYDKLEEENVIKVATAEAVCARVTYFSLWVVPPWLLSNCRYNESLRCFTFSEARVVSI